MSDLPPEITYTVEMTAFFTRRDPQVIRYWVRNGTIKSERVGNRADGKNPIRIPASELEKILMLPRIDPTTHKPYEPREAELVRQSDGRKLRVTLPGG